jgi:hypothetical protein
VVKILVFIKYTAQFWKNGSFWDLKLDHWVALLMMKKKIPNSNEKYSKFENGYLIITPQGVK